MINRWHKGFTLAEVLVAIALFTALIIPIVRIFNFVSTANRKTVDSLIAANLAQQKMEYLRNLPFSAYIEGKDSNGQVLNGVKVLKPDEESYVEISPTYPNFKTQWRISYFPNPDPQNDLDLMKRVQIVVEVSWPKNKYDKKLKLFTLVTHHGVL